jgi:outer membrane protein OmpA-like peptidoglycan-associated protein
MKSDWDTNPESRTGNCFARATAAMAVLFVLAGCSSVPGWADPTEWFGSDSSSNSGESTQQATAAIPGEGREYPNLASVPERPKAPTEEERKRLTDNLTADRENAEYSEEVIRRQSAASVPAPPSPPPSAASVQARAASTANAATTGALAAGTSAAQRPATPLPTPPSFQPPAMSAAAPAPGSALTQEPVSRPPRFAPRPPSPVAPDVGANSVSPRAMRPGPNTPSVARIGNPSFGAPPSDIAAARDAVGTQQSFPSRFEAPPQVSGTFANPSPASSGEPAATVRFMAGSASLTGNARAQVREIAQMYRQRGGGIRVEGHASSRTRNMDPVQHHLVNFNVSLNRANAVAEELVRQGVPSEAVFVAAMSDSQPLYYEVMPAGDAGNQRVEIHFVN